MGVFGLTGQVESGVPGCARGWQASPKSKPDAASTEESSPQWLVASSAQQPGMAKFTTGISTPLQDAVPHSTGTGGVAVPAVPAAGSVPLPLLPPFAEPARPALPAALELESEEFPPQAGAASAPNRLLAAKKPRIREDIARKCSMRSRQMRALPAATRAPPERGLRVNFKPRLEASRHWRQASVRPAPFYAPGCAVAHRASARPHPTILGFS